MKIIRFLAILATMLALLTAGVVWGTSFLLPLDLAVENFLLSVRSSTLVEQFTLFTYLGETSVIIAITLVVTLLLVYKRQWAYALGVKVAVVGALTTNYVMKHLIERERPGGLIPTSIDTSSSFPSGHATFSMALYGTLAYLLCRLYPQHARAIVWGAVALMGMMGFSRLYLGFHFPTDVVAGLILGAFWVIVGVVVIKKFHR